MKRRVLLVGAGAVGQVYGRHLQLGGCEVAFLARPRYADDLRRGLVVYPVNAVRRRTPVAFRDFGVLTSADEVRAQGPWDEVWLCIASTALPRNPDPTAPSWLDELIAAMGDATLVSLQPGPKDRALILHRLAAVRGTDAADAEARFVQGVIAFSSWQAPLPTERLPRPGMAYWFPPASPSPFRGSPERVDPLVDALTRGGCPAAVRPAAVAGASFASCLLMSIVAALELAGWSFAKLARDRRLLRDTAAAARQAATAVAPHARAPRPRAFDIVASSAVIRTLLTLAPRVVPFDIEAFFAWHFTKVGAQTIAHLDTYADFAAAQGRPAPAVVRLRDGLIAARGPLSRAATVES